MTRSRSTSFSTGSAYPWPAFKSVSGKALPRPDLAATATGR
jgi:hypothetical protein